MLFQSQKQTNPIAVYLFCHYLYRYLIHLGSSSLPFHSQQASEELTEVLNQLWLLDTNRQKPGTDYIISLQVSTSCLTALLPCDAKKKKKNSAKDKGVTLQTPSGTESQSVIENHTVVSPEVD